MAFFWRSVAQFGSDWQRDRIDKDNLSDSLLKKVLPTCVPVAIKVSKEVQAEGGFPECGHCGECNAVWVWVDQRNHRRMNTVDWKEVRKIVRALKSRFKLQIKDDQVHASVKFKRCSRPPKCYSIVASKTKKVGLRDFSVPIRNFRVVATPKTAA